MNAWVQALVPWLADLWTVIKKLLASAEGWSAIAAIAASFAAFKSYAQQRDSARDAIRPELRLHGWTLRESELGAYYEVRFSAIENIGVGTAFDVTIAQREVDENDPLNKSLTPTPVLIDVLTPNSPVASSQRIMVKMPDTEPLIERFNVVLFYSDRRGTRYVTTYRMMVNWMPGASKVTVAQRATVEL